MKVSIITATFNSSAAIADCVNSVLSQTHPVEHIIVDNMSTDNTLEIVRRLSSAALILSEPDNGIYDAMNKGLRLATGDVIGILNSDDFYASNNVIETISNIFSKKRVDSVFADLVFVKPGNLKKVVRYYRAANFTPDKFAYGWMPPHPTFFARREIYDTFGLFKTDYQIAADYELLVRFLAKHKISYHYLPEVIVKMRVGGKSTKNLKSNWILNKEIIRACKENGIKTNVFKVYSKYVTKVFQLAGRPAR